jgi:hypothetical protein
MIVILANKNDAAARALVDQAHGEAHLLSARDLSQPGWRHRPTGGEEIALIGGRRMAPSDISAVVTRIPAVAPQMLGHIQLSDREFVAAEMNAFLLSWLSRLGCLVVNRPTAGCLMGPAWSHERWLVEGYRAGFEPCARTLPAPFPPPEATRSVVVVGDACVGDAARDLGERARALARRAGVTLVGFRVDDRDRLIAVEPWPDLAQPEIAGLLLSLLRGAPRMSSAHRGAA